MSSFPSKTNVTRVWLSFYLAKQRGFRPKFRQTSLHVKIYAVSKEGSNVVERNFGGRAGATWNEITGARWKTKVTGGRDKAPSGLATRELPRLRGEGFEKRENRNGLRGWKRGSHEKEKRKMAREREKERERTEQRKAVESFVNLRVVSKDFIWPHCAIGIDVIQLTSL